jgi:hypothetical protein
MSIYLLKFSSIFYGIKRDRGNGLATLSGSSRRSFAVFSAAQNSAPFFRKEKRDSNILAKA